MKTFPEVSEGASPLVSHGTARRLAPALWSAAAGLLASALWAKYQTGRAERVNPPKGAFITVDGVRLHYVDHGEGPALVLIHGLGSMVEDFLLSGLVERAAERYRVLAFDRPGYGHSERPDGRAWTPREQALLLHEAVRELGVRKAIVLGHSWGTLVAIEWALTAPTDVAALVLLSGQYYPTLRLDAALMIPPAVPGLGTVLRHTLSPVFGRALWPAMRKLLFSPAPVPQSFARYPVWMAMRASQLEANGADSAMTVPTATALEQRYRELQVPVTIMAGADENYVSARAHSGRLHRDIPGSVLKLIPRVGHMIHHLVPDAVLDAIDEARRFSVLRESTEQHPAGDAPANPDRVMAPAPGHTSQ